MKIRLAALSAIALFVLITPSFAQKTISKSFTGVNKVELSTGSGNCEIKKGTGNAVLVEIKHTYGEDYSPRFSQVGSMLVVEESNRNNHDHGQSWWTVTLPEGVAVEYSTGSGNFSAAGISSDMKIRSGSGNLAFADLKGAIRATTGSGDVEVTGYVGEGSFSTGSGDISLSRADGELSLTCGSGDIEVDDSKAAIKATTGSGDIAATKLIVKGSSKFTTGSGRARVSLAATATFDISITSGSGDAELIYNGNEIVGEIVMRASKRHGNISAPFEFDSVEEDDRNGDNATVVKTVVKGKGTNRISISTGSGDAVLKK